MLYAPFYSDISLFLTIISRIRSGDALLKHNITDYATQSIATGHPADTHPAEFSCRSAIGGTCRFSARNHDHRREWQVVLANASTKGTFRIEPAPDRSSEPADCAVRCLRALHAAAAASARRAALYECLSAARGGRSAALSSSCRRRANSPNQSRLSGLARVSGCTLCSSGWPLNVSPARSTTNRGM